MEKQLQRNVSLECRLQRRLASTIKLDHWFFTFVIDENSIQKTPLTVVWGRVQETESNHEKTTTASSIASTSTSFQTNNNNSTVKHVKLTKYYVKSRVSDKELIDQEGRTIILVDDFDFERARKAGITEPYIDTFKHGIPDAYIFFVMATATRVLERAAETSSENILNPGDSRSPSPEPQPEPATTSTSMYPKQPFSLYSTDSDIAIADLLPGDSLLEGSRFSYFRNKDSNSQRSADVPRTVLERNLAVRIKKALPVVPNPRLTWSTPENPRSPMRLDMRNNLEKSFGHLHDKNGVYVSPIFTTKGSVIREVNGRRTRVIVSEDGTLVRLYERWYKDVPGQPSATPLPPAPPVPPVQPLLPTVQPLVQPLLPVQPALVPSTPAQSLPLSLPPTQPLPLPLPSTQPRPLSLASAQSLPLNLPSTRLPSRLPSAQSSIITSRLPPPPMNRSPIIISDTPSPEPEAEPESSIQIDSNLNSSRQSQSNRVVLTSISSSSKQSGIPLDSSTNTTSQLKGKGKEKVQETSSTAFIPGLFLLSNSPSVSLPIQTDSSSLAIRTTKQQVEKKELIIEEKEVVAIEVENEESVEKYINNEEEAVKSFEKESTAELHSPRPINTSSPTFKEIELMIRNDDEGKELESEEEVEEKITVIQNQEEEKAEVIEEEDEAEVEVSESNLNRQLTRPSTWSPTPPRPEEIDVQGAVETISHHRSSSSSPPPAQTMYDPSLSSSPLNQPTGTGFAGLYAASDSDSHDESGDIFTFLQNDIQGVGGEIVTRPYVSTYSRPAQLNESVVVVAPAAAIEEERLESPAVEEEEIEPEVNQSIQESPEPESAVLEEKIEKLGIEQEEVEEEMLEGVKATEVESEEDEPIFQVVQILDREGSDGTISNPNSPIQIVQSIVQQEQAIPVASVSDVPVLSLEVDPERVAVHEEEEESNQTFIPIEAPIEAPQPAVQVVLQPQIQLRPQLSPVLPFNSTPRIASPVIRKRQEAFVEIEVPMNRKKVKLVESPSIVEPDSLQTVDGSIPVASTSSNINSSRESTSKSALDYPPFSPSSTSTRLPLPALTPILSIQTQSKSLQSISRPPIIPQQILRPIILPAASISTPPSVISSKKVDRVEVNEELSDKEVEVEEVVAEIEVEEETIQPKPMGRRSKKSQVVNNSDSGEEFILPSKVSAVAIGEFEEEEQPKYSDQYPDQDQDQEEEEEEEEEEIVVVKKSSKVSKGKGKEIKSPVSELDNSDDDSDDDDNENEEEEQDALIGEEEEEEVTEEPEDDYQSSGYNQTLSPELNRSSSSKRSAKSETASVAPLSPSTLSRPIVGRKSSTSTFTGSTSKSTNKSNLKSTTKSSVIKKSTTKSSITISSKSRSNSTTTLPTLALDRPSPESEESEESEESTTEFTKPRAKGRFTVPYTKNDDEVKVKTKLARSSTSTSASRKSGSNSKSNKSNRASLPTVAASGGGGSGRPSRNVKVPGAFWQAQVQLEAIQSTKRTIRTIKVPILPETRRSSFNSRMRPAASTFTRASNSNTNSNSNARASSSRTVAKVEDDDEEDEEEEEEESADDDAQEEEQKEEESNDGEESSRVDSNEEEEEQQQQQQQDMIDRDQSFDEDEGFDDEEEDEEDSLDEEEEPKSKSKSKSKQSSKSSNQSRSKQDKVSGGVQRSGSGKKVKSNNKRKIGSTAVIRKKVKSKTSSSKFNSSGSNSSRSSSSSKPKPKATSSKSKSNSTLEKKKKPKKKRRKKTIEVTSSDEEEEEESETVYESEEEENSSSSIEAE